RPRILSCSPAFSGRFCMVERPNTISGLKAKHAELTELRKRYLFEIKKLTVDIDHLDAAIRLFDPDADSSRLKGYIIKHKAQKGTVKRFILQCLREAKGPLTSRQITEMWIADRQLVADEATYSILRKRIGASIKAAARHGLVVDRGTSTDHGE